ncbi:MAG: hypothetical protein IKV33_06175 [Alistipes sp.]|nr:hypothetical protein [Alistipes sp.]
MKRTIMFMFVAFATMFMSVSCLSFGSFGKEYEDPDYAEIVTIVDGSYNTQYYVEFDDGKTASINSNKAGSSITFPSEPAQMRGESRKLIFYNDAGKPEAGFDMSIDIMEMYNVSSELIKLTTDSKVESVLKEHNDNIAINGVAYAKNRKYLTLQLCFYQSTELSYKHSILVAHNPNKDGMFKEIYDDQKEADNYLWLELYHDAAGDTTTNNMEVVYSSIKLDEEILGVTNILNYKGIKIIYNSIDVNAPVVHTYDFQ